QLGQQILEPVPALLRVAAAAQHQREDPAELLHLLRPGGERRLALAGRERPLLGLAALLVDEELLRGRQLLQVPQGTAGAVPVRASRYQRRGPEREWNGAAGRASPRSPAQIERPGRAPGRADPRGGSRPAREAGARRPRGPPGVSPP